VDFRQNTVPGIVQKARPLGIKNLLPPPITIAASNFKFDYGKTPVLGTTNQPYTHCTTLSIASQPTKNLMFGVNVNYLSPILALIKQTGISILILAFLKRSILEKVNSYIHWHQGLVIQILAPVFLL